MVATPGNLHVVPWRRCRRRTGQTLRGKKARKFTYFEGVFDNVLTELRSLESELKYPDKDEISRTKREIEKLLRALLNEFQSHSDSLDARRESLKKRGDFFLDKLEDLLGINADEDDLRYVSEVKREENKAVVDIVKEFVADLLEALEPDDQLDFNEIGIVAVAIEKKCWRSRTGI